MGDWWIYPIVGIGIAFVTWIFGAEQEGDEDRELAAARGIGPTIGDSVAKFFAKSVNRDVCRRLVAAGVNTTADALGHGQGPLAGKTLVVTGLRARRGRRQPSRFGGGRARDGQCLALD